jgi:hypothetical protein
MYDVTSFLPVPFTVEDEVQIIRTPFDKIILFFSRPIFGAPLPDTSHF